YTLTSLTSANIPGGTEAFGDHVIFNTYPLFADTATGDFRLLPCSPAVNKGDNVTVDTINLSNDLDGNSRIYQDTVDLGAYEMQDTCQTISVIEPTDLMLVYLSPNPVYKGNQLLVQVLSEIFPGELYWLVTDANGKQINEGMKEGVFTSEFSISAPKIPGVYFLIIHGG